MMRECWLNWQSICGIKIELLSTINFDLADKGTLLVTKGHSS